jgi:hypothetical protein
MRRFSCSSGLVVRHQAVLREAGMFDSDAIRDALIWLALLLIPVLIGLAAMASRAGGRL